MIYTTAFCTPALHPCSLHACSTPLPLLRSLYNVHFSSAYLLFVDLQRAVPCTMYTLAAEVYRQGLCYYIISLILVISPDKFPTTLRPTTSYRIRKGCSILIALLHYLMPQYLASVVYNFLKNYDVLFVSLYHIIYQSVYDISPLSFSLSSLVQHPR